MTTNQSKNAIADAIIDSLVSQSVANSSLESANVVDVLSRLANACGAISLAITPKAEGIKVQDGGFVESLTEAVIFNGNGLYSIAAAIDNLADAVRNNTTK
jgi:hypothetical protein